MFREIMTQLTSANNLSRPIPWRRITTRYEKLARISLAMVTIAMILEWL